MIGYLDNLPPRLPKYRTAQAKPELPNLLAWSVSRALLSGAIFGEEPLLAQSGHSCSGTNWRPKVPFGMC
jgi:hypothetical protein